MSIRVRIGAELRALRIKRGLTESELGELCEMSCNHIVKIENGRYNVRLDTADKIANALGAKLSLVECDE